MGESSRSWQIFFFLVQKTCQAKENSLKSKVSNRQVQLLDINCWDRLNPSVGHRTALSFQYFVIFHRLLCLFHWWRIWQLMSVRSQFNVMWTELFSSHLHLLHLSQPAQGLLPYLLPPSVKSISLFLCLLPACPGLLLISCFWEIWDIFVSVLCSL